MKISLPLKNDIEEREFNLKILYYESDNYYEIKAFNSQNKEVSRITFKTQNRPRQIWLNKIWTDEDFLHQGYATAIIKAFEYVAYMLRYDTIEGKFYPENEFAKPFYDKFGYSIDKDGYETFVGKRLNFEEIKFNIEPYIKDYKIDTICNELER